MIVGEQKPFEEIWNMIRQYRRVLVLGCNTCVAVCHSGGEKEAHILSEVIQIKASSTDTSIEVNHMGLVRQCENEYIDDAIHNLQTYEAILSLACGVGVNFLSQKIGSIPVLPGLNTTFYGSVEEAGVFAEMCVGCGDCILHLTGGICPIARCPKSIMNGPCGGTNNGKCEIGVDTDCAWYLIIQRMKALGILHLLEEIQPPRDWSKSFHGGPRRMFVSHVMLNKREDANK
ncbi:MAG: methylenetetrahydrofolate reductase C-terminal domain-containing protein [Thermodesulfovibrionales bacterium]|nr:methylenetetrahydrofolate reductase C-terminal domain-containing protein [Thermodesulfovibrionales bacterium]